MRLHFLVTTLWSLLTFSFFIGTSIANPPHPRHLTITASNHRDINMNFKSGHPNTNTGFSETVDHLATRYTHNSAPSAHHHDHQVQPTAKSTPPPIENITLSSTDPLESTTSEPPVQKNLINEKEKQLLYLIGNYGFEQAGRILEGRVISSLRTNLTADDRARIKESLLKALYDFHVSRTSNSTPGGIPHSHNISGNWSQIKLTITKTTALPSFIPDEAIDGVDDLPDFSDEEQLDGGSMVYKRSSKASDAFPDLATQTKQHEHSPIHATSITRESTALTSPITGAKVTSETMKLTHLHSKHPAPPSVPVQNQLISKPPAPHGVPVQNQLPSKPPAPPGVPFQNQLVSKPPAPHGVPVQNQFMSKPPAPHSIPVQNQMHSKPSAPPGVPVSTQLLSRTPPVVPNPTETISNPQGSIEQSDEQWTVAPQPTSSTTETQVILHKTEKAKTGNGSCPTFAGFLTTGQELWTNLLKSSGFVSSMKLVMDAWFGSMKTLGTCFFGMGSQIWSYFYGLFTSG